MIAAVNNSILPSGEYDNTILELSKVDGDAVKKTLIYYMETMNMEFMPTDGTFNCENDTKLFEPVCLYTCIYF